MTQTEEAAQNGPGLTDGLQQDVHRLGNLKKKEEHTLRRGEIRRNKNPINETSYGEKRRR